MFVLYYARNNSTDDWRECFAEVVNPIADETYETVAQYAMNDFLAGLFETQGREAGATEFMVEICDKRKSQVTLTHMND